MNTSTDIIRISGKSFLKCNSDGCQWNVFCTPIGPSIPGMEISVREEEMPRVCNFGIAAYRIIGLPDDCHYQNQVKEVLGRITYNSSEDDTYQVRSE